MGISVLYLNKACYRIFSLNCSTSMTIILLLKLSNKGNIKDYVYNLKPSLISSNLFTSILLENLPRCSRLVRGNDHDVLVIST